MNLVFPFPTNENTAGGESALITRSGLNLRIHLLSASATSNVEEYSLALRVGLRGLAVKRRLASMNSLWHLPGIGLLPVHNATSNPAPESDVARAAVNLLPPPRKLALYTVSATLNLATSRILPS